MSSNSVIGKIAKPFVEVPKTVVGAASDAGGFVGNAVGGQTGRKVGSIAGSLMGASGVTSTSAGQNPVSQASSGSEVVNKGASALLSQTAPELDAPPELPAEDEKTKEMERAAIAQTKTRGRAANMLSSAKSLTTSSVKSAGRTLLGA